MKAADGERLTGGKTLLGMTLDELRAVADETHLPSFAAKQLARWLYVRRAADVGVMTDLSLAARERLAAAYTVGRHAAVLTQRSLDGTEKYLFPVSGGATVETVYIPDGERATLCVSSQVGCRMNCLFCQTGKQGFEGHLTPGDIINQVVSQERPLTNIVFMGQGEPMDNLDSVLRATEILTADYAMAWSPRRITVSTVGLRDKLRRFLDESRCHVAVSLHTPFAEQRALLMPAERAMPLQETVDLLRRYDFSGQRRLSFEYIVFGGVNDSMSHARATARLLRGLSCRVNLIRYHEIPGVDLRPATEEAVLRLRDYLTGHGIFTTIRASRGQDIAAACGLLNTNGKKI